MIGGQAIKSGGGFPERLTESARRSATMVTMDKKYLREHTAADVPSNLLRVGSENVEPRLLVWGDSHAMAVLPAIDELRRAAGTRAVRLAVHSGWPPILARCLHGAASRRSGRGVFGRGRRPNRGRQVRHGRARRGLVAVRRSGVRPGWLRPSSDSCALGTQVCNRRCRSFRTTSPP